MYHMEDGLLYHPELPPHSRLIVSVPSIFGLPYESVNTWTADGTQLHLLVILQPNASKEVPTVLYLHGNAGNVGHRYYLFRYQTKGRRALISVREMIQVLVLKYL